MVERIFGQRPGAAGTGNLALTETELSGARADFALVSLFMGNDYLPKIKNGEMKRVLPIYLKLRKGFQRRSLVVDRPLSKTGKKSEVSNNGDATPNCSVYIDWVMLLELLNRLSAGQPHDQDDSDLEEDDEKAKIEASRASIPDSTPDSAMAPLFLTSSAHSTAAPSALPLFMDLGIPTVKSDLEAKVEPEPVPVPVPEPEPEPEQVATASTKKMNRRDRSVTRAAARAQDYFAGLLWNMTMIRDGNSAYPLR